MEDEEQSAIISTNGTDSVVDKVASDLAATELDESVDLVSFKGRALKLNTEEDAQEIVDSIYKCQNMTAFSLEGNTLGPLAAKCIGKALEGKPTLKRASLRDMFTGRLKTEIPDAVRYLTAGINLANAKLSELDLSDNAFGPIGVKALIPFLETPACEELRILRLNNNGLGPEGGKLLGKALQKLNNLETFICGRNRLENEAARVIGKSLSEKDTLINLEMPQNGIRAEGMEFLAQAILSNVNLKVINLNDNTMTSAGGESIACSLNRLQCIEVINFGDCLLRPNGFIAVVEALKEAEAFKTLKELNLSGNEVGGPDAEEVILSIFSASYPRLKLDLGANNFGEDAVAKIKNVIKKNVDLLLSDDEGTADEDEDGEYVDEDQEDADEGGEGGDEEEDVVGDESKRLQEEQLEEINKMVENPDTTVDKLIQKFIRITVDEFDVESSTISSGSLIVSDRLLREATNRGDPYMVANQLLVHMGMIKGENGNRFHVDVDLRGPFFALHHSIACLHKTVKSVLQFFVSRPHKASDQTGKIKHKLLQALFT